MFPVSASDDLAATCLVLQVPLVSVSEKVVDETVRLGAALRVELGKSVRRNRDGVREGGLSLRSE